MTAPRHARPDISIVLATHNRRDVVLDTLAHVRCCGLPRERYETIVVDNASSDGTPDAIESIGDHVLRLTTNRGSCAKAFGVDHARGELVVFLDDDSYPTPGSLQTLLAHFADHPRLGAAGFRVTLPDGREEGAALPHVFVGCGVGLRRSALQAVGGLDRSFFMQAEEYDLSFRLANAGWRVEVFDDLEVLHAKTPQARRSERTTFYDTRNNLRVIARYIPGEYQRAFRDDAIQRYRWMAERDGHVAAFRRGLRAGRTRAFLERWTYRRHRLRPGPFESFFHVQRIEQRMKSLANRGIARVVFADLGKNIFPFAHGAELAGVKVLAVGDDRFASPGRHYRGVPVLTLAEALSQHCDAVVVANSGPVHAARTAANVRERTRLPVFDWFGESTPSDAGFASPTPSAASDDIETASAAPAGCR